MGGPVCLVKLPEVQLDKLAQLVEGAYAEYDYYVIGWGDGILEFSIYPPKQENSEENTLLTCKEHFGFVPAQVVDIGANCNSATDHIAVGQFALSILKRFGGIVEFCGAIVPSSPWKINHDIGSMDLVDWSLLEEPFRKMVEKMPGKIVGIPYLNASGRRWVSHIADAAFLEAWLKHPQFHMIK